MDDKAFMAKRIILDEMRKNNLEVRKIILFGSRATENFRDDSDWDFMIIIETGISFTDRAKVTARVKRKLLENNFPNDVIVKYCKDYEYGSNHVGSMSYTAEKEGISI